MTELVLTTGQQSALSEFVQFLYSPDEIAFVLEGYSGTGKSTLVHTLIDRLSSYIKAALLINPDFPDYALQLTATTNKAAENFALITGMDVITIHKFLGLRVQKDMRTGYTNLVPTSAVKSEGYLLFVDEASMLDPAMISHIFNLTHKCKIVFIGDPAQLAPVKMSHSPIFKAGFRTARLTEVMRQLVNGVPKANPITDLATGFRDTVNTGVWPKFKPDGDFVQWLPRDQFMQAMEEEFVRPEWHYKDSKVLAWTNNTVIAYNKRIRNLLKGDPALQVGDYAENNSYVQIGKASIKTDQTVYISDLSEDTEVHGVLGNMVEVDHAISTFMPRYREDKVKLITYLRNNERFREAEDVSNWIDLRAVFAQTINKSQGSTYGRVFIDLDDIARCNSGNQMARLLYVGVSRAQKQVIMTGDIA